ncbi:DNA-binding response regulator [Zobellella endophytica]|uniref:DNA-binding response regulator n=1 Tax=Zobellella endophytica TaxID=2116700 RepID=A0A2P7R6H1_9GAMM|nr:response regulator [Zobellella endophytica]PSJ45797.1 DNA-binding response regulator [Zobellella endophytica]
MYLLLVEDDLALGNALVKLLKAHYRVEWVRQLAAARAHFAAAEIELILLDLGLPDGDGLGWLQQLRSQGHELPVLILSARDQLDDRVQGLDTGADDYLVKPFEPDELLARIRVLLRRQAGQASPVIHLGALSFYPDSQQFMLHDRPLTLPPKEQQLLRVLAMARGQTVSRERLTQQLYGMGNGADSNTLEVHIHALRRQLGKDRILTIRGQGYRLVAL